jgi:hypothetical protein
MAGYGYCHGGTGTRFDRNDQTPTVQTNAEGDAVSPKLIAGNKSGFLPVTATSNGEVARLTLVVATI